MPRARFRTVRSAANFLLISGLTLTQTGCLSNYMWESRLITAGEYREGRVKFEGDLRDAKFNAAGDLAIHGIMTQAHADVENNTDGRLIIPASSMGWFTKQLGFRSVRSDYNIRALPAEPEYTLPTQSHKNQREEKEAYRRGYERLQFIAGDAPGDFSIPCLFKEEFLDYKQSDNRPQNKPSPGSSLLKIDFDPTKYPAGGDIPDTAGKVILTPVTAALDIAGVPACIALMPVVGVVLIVGAFASPCCPMPPEGFEEPTEEDYRLRNFPKLEPETPLHPTATAN